VPANELRVVVARVGEPRQAKKSKSGKRPLLLSIRLQADLVQQAHGADSPSARFFGNYQSTASHRRFVV
jgi:hypothetical protein